MTSLPTGPGPDRGRGRQGLGTDDAEERVVIFQSSLVNLQIIPQKSLFYPAFKGRAWHRRTGQVVLEPTFPSFPL